MTRFLSSRLLALLFVAAIAAHAADVPGVPEALQGTWALVGFVEEGSAAPAEMLEGARVVFSSNGMVIISPDATEKTEYTISVDTTRSPRAINLTRLEGSFAGQATNGIYELEGTTLRICAALRPGLARPAKFA